MQRLGRSGLRHIASESFRTGSLPLRKSFIPFQRPFVSTATKKLPKHSAMEHSFPNFPEVFSKAEHTYPDRLKNSWYLTTTSALVGSGNAAAVAQLYQYLIKKDEYSTSDSRKALVRRIREALVKCIVLVGIPSVMEAFMALAKVEAPEDQDHTMTRKGWQADAANHERGKRVLDTLYEGEHEVIYDTFGSHKIIPWISTDISYGLFLADHTELNILETELVILPNLICQNLRNESMWHMRGAMRVGATREEVEKVHQTAEIIAAIGERPLKDIGRVATVQV